MEITQAPKKFLPDSGIVFEGLENVKLKSREEVGKKIEEYLEVVSREKRTTVRAILAEWGEGKTDAYERYIKQKAKSLNFSPYFVSTSTILSSLDILEKHINRTALLSQQFLIALFWSIREEEKIIELPTPSYSEKVDDFIIRCIELLSENGKKKLVVFIDEFEEALTSVEKLKKLLSGLKEVINGQFEPIHEGGKFEGILHLIIAVTPDAFYKIESNPEFSLIFGGLGRRIGVINLPPIRRKEGVEFLWNLIKICYENNLPEKLPISSIGCLNVIYKITLGNPGNMVSKLSRLIGRSLKEAEEIDREGKFIKVIDFDLILRFFANESIWVYGGSTRCIENENLEKILKRIGDQVDKVLGEECKLVFKLLLGEYKPFSPEEIQSRLKIRKRLEEIIEVLDEDIKRSFGIKGIIRVSKLKEDKDEIKKVLEEFIHEEGGEKYIKIDNYVEKLDEFFDKLTFLNIEKGELKEEIYLPREPEDIKEFFEGIADIRAKELKNKFTKLLEDKENLLLSDNLLTQIFPPPIPRGLEFIKDREARIRLWREVTKNFFKEFRDNFPQAFLSILNLAEINVIGEDYNQNAIFATITWKIVLQDVKISCLLYSVDGDVKADDIEDIYYNKIKNYKKPVHLVLLIYTGEITERAEEKLNDLEIGEKGENIVLRLRLHPTLAKKLIVINKCLKTKSIEADEISIKNAAELIIEEIDFKNKLNEWLEDQKKRGKLVSDVKLKNAKSLNDLLGALKFYINYIEEPLTPDEAYSKNRGELMKFIKYGSRTVFIEDIESSGKLRNISYDLEDNGLIKGEKEGKFRVIEHPIEKRIINLLKEEKKCTYDALEKHFIIAAKMEKILQNLYIPILKHKGFIKEEEKMIKLVSEDDLIKEFERIKEKIKNIEKKKLEDYGFIYVWKEREDRFIQLKEFLEFISKKMNEIEKSSYSHEQKKQKIFLLSELVDDFSKTWIEAIERAKQGSKEKISDLESKKQRLEKSVEEIKKYFDDFLKIKIVEIGEIRKINTIWKEINEIDSKFEFNFLDFVKRKDDFNFKKEGFPYFNVKAYVISIKSEEMEKEIKSIGDIVDSILKRFKDVEAKLNEIKRKMREIRLEEYLELSNILHKKIESTSKNVFPELKERELKITSIKEINEISEGNLGEINKRFEALNKLVEKLKEMTKKEEEFHRRRYAKQEYIKKAEEVLDLEEMQIEVKEIISEFGKLTDLSVLKKYLEEVEIDFGGKQELFFKIDKIIEELKNRATNLESIKSHVDEIWLNYRSKVETYIETQNKIIKAIEKRNEENRNKKIQKKEIADLKINIEILGDEVKPKDIITIKKASEIEKIRLSIRQKLYDILKTVLDKEEVDVLEIIASASDVCWKEKLYKDLEEKKLKIEDKRLNEILQKLENEGFIRIGITLSIK